MTEIKQLKASIEKGVAEATKHFVGRPLNTKTISEIRNVCLPILLRHTAIVADRLLNQGDDKPEFGVEIEEGGGISGYHNIIWVAKNREAVEVLSRLGFSYYDATDLRKKRKKLGLHIPKEVGEGDDAWIWYSRHGPGSHWMPKTEVGGSSGYVHYDAGEYTIDGTYTKGQIINLVRLLDIDPELKPPTEEQGEMNGKS